MPDLEHFCIHNCYACDKAVVVEPKGFKSVFELVGIYGLWEALCIVEVRCPYKDIIEDLEKGGGLSE